MSKKPTPESYAVGILKRIGITEAPIPVELVARWLGLQVEPGDLGDDVSGVLVVNDDKGMIGYNSSHPAVRQRFTIAHELGHFEMHRNEAGLFIDKRYFVAFRDSRSSTGDELQERQANAFAAALLMPEDILRKEIKKQSFDLADEAALDALAELFQVSKQAMTYRLANLRVWGVTEQ